MFKYFKIQRAREEITHLNVEIRRLHTAIVDENTDLVQWVSPLHKTDSILANAADAFLWKHLRINAIHLQRLCAIEVLPGFSGVMGTSVWVGCERCELNLKLLKALLMLMLRLKLMQARMISWMKLWLISVTLQRVWSHWVLETCLIGSYNNIIYVLFQKSLHARWRKMRNVVVLFCTTCLHACEHVAYMCLAAA